MLTLTNSLFLIFSIFLVTEILSQVLQLEVVGQVFNKFYAILVHLLILLALFSYEDQQVLNYFIALIALVNSLRFVVYKVPAFERGSWARFFIDAFVIGVMGIVVYFAFNILEIEIIVNPIVDEVKYFYLAALVIVLLYEMIQKALEVGLQTSRFLPQSFISFIVEYSLLLLGIAMVVAIFLIEQQYKVMLYQALPFYILFNIIVVSLSGLINDRDTYQYSLSYILPTIVTVLFFIGIII
jgi:hypothetical protein